MPNYNLYGLDPRTFQQMVQALAVQAFGAGVIVYGDGKDGGRDASFEGKVNYPSNAEAWNGYILIQAKYRQKPIDDISKAGDWVLEQLKIELEKIKKAQKTLDYYLLITNIDLTPAPNVGTEAKVRKLLTKYKKALKFKNFDVWDGNKIRRLLDANRNIAITYGGYVMAGDVLAKMLTYLTLEAPNFEEVISDYLQAEIAGPERLARLTEAGSASERKTVLADVFVDLPVADKQIINPVRKKDDESLIGFLNLVLLAGALSHDRKSMLQRASIRAESEESYSIDGHFVLIGGPGQGKSTLGQFICQLYRSAILQDRPAEKISADANLAINYIIKKWQENGHELPTTRRFPVRVELKAFADELAKEKCLSLIDYIAQRINKCAAQEVHRKDLQLWLSSYPWLLVLDGLDEVPASGNRTEVMDAIKQFSMQCATRNADILIIATSRPQGYSEEFSSEEYKHYYLVPLSKERALYYAKRLVEACHRDNIELGNDIFGRLERSASRPTTTRLMHSPLQITILAVLAALKGELPDDRWQLFEDYYQIICNRETQRNQALSSIIREYTNEVGKVHENVGLKLQVASETEGENDALLDPNQLYIIAYNSIKECFSDGQESLRIELTNKIQKAALERLVFLVSPQDNKIGFEIRSLQEFMAARALMSGSDPQISGRLKAIGQYPFWRNVFLFSAGKCAKDRSYLADHILAICIELNTSPDFACSLTLAGSRLALDLLEDETFRRHRPLTRSLLDIALKLLELPIFDWQYRLAAIYRPNSDSEHLFTTAILNRFSMTNFIDRLSAWSILLGLIEAGNEWAEEIADSYWPIDIEQQYKIIDLLPSLHSKWLTTKFIALVPKLSSLTILHMIDVPELNGVPNWFKAALALGSGAYDCSSMKFNLGNDSISPLHFTFTGIKTDNIKKWKDIIEMPDPNDTWACIISVIRFILTPTKEVLSEELCSLYKFGVQETGDWMVKIIMPWPLCLCLDAVKNGEDIQSLSLRIKSGEFGDSVDWFALEELWTSKGINENDVLSLNSNSHLFETGWSLFKRNTSILSQNPYIDCVNSLTRLFDKADTIESQSFIASFVVNILAQMSSKYLAHTPEVFTHFPDADKYHQWMTLAYTPDRLFYGSFRTLLAFPLDSEIPRDWIALFNKIGSQKFAYFMDRTHLFRTKRNEIPKNFITQVVNEYTQEPDKKGLLIWLALFALNGEKIGVKVDFNVLSNFTRQEKFALLIIRLTQGDIADDEYNKLISLAVELVESTDCEIAIHLIHCVDDYPNEAWAIKYITDLQSLLKTKKPYVVRLCIRWMERRVSSRCSSLHNECSISELGLGNILH